MTAMVYIIGCTLLQIMRYTTDVPDWLFIAYNIMLGLAYLLESFMKGE